MYDFSLDDNDNIKLLRNNVRKKKKKYKPKGPQYKYGIRVPRNVDEAVKFDKDNGNTFWQDATRLEMSTLMDLECFEFKSKGYRPGPGWQPTTLHIIYDVKQDLRHKARLVAGGHLVNILDHAVYASTVKNISVMLLHVIAHKTGLDQLCGDITNAFVTAYTNEKIYCIARLEFGEENVGKTIIIRKALYGLASSAERFHTHLANSLRSFGFKPTRYDNDVWYRNDDKNSVYEYICTHVDDFMIVSKTPKKVMSEIETIFGVKDSSKGPPDYYLGNDYKKDKKGRWCIGCKKYLKEAITRVENLMGEVPKCNKPIEANDHPEEDSSNLLDDDNHKKYQMLIGMLNWIVTIGRLDIAYAVSSLSRFTSCPRKGHLERAISVFGYLKRYPNRRIVVDSSDPEIEGDLRVLEPDYTEVFKEFCPDACEECDRKIPPARIDEMEITCFVDSDHGHDRVTRRSITGIVIFVGRTPVYFSSKRQGAIETSTYGAEFCAMKSAVEEVTTIRYMLRYLGVNISYASLVCGDNMGVI